ncbi:hypothetical protein AAT19DRAFT_14205 [Rhodotorula toruloides]|uniref:Uncharacterized protein n=1 Tax=Rhodotorula toruloides TaxID=5286 RepID=A0A2T0AAZ9_RHOTO|nr:hypothetical protein AAT19DRAFT_14205 [Rhodotorula toruloides]
MQAAAAGRGRRHTEYQRCEQVAPSEAKQERGRERRMDKGRDEEERQRANDIRRQCQERRSVAKKTCCKEREGEYDCGRCEDNQRNEKDFNPKASVCELTVRRCDEERKDARSTARRGRRYGGGRKS